MQRCRWNWQIGIFMFYKVVQKHNSSFSENTVTFICAGFHENRFTFDGVIAERVNTTKLPRRVNPIFCRSLASSRIIMLTYYPR